MLTIARVTDIVRFTFEVFSDPTNVTERPEMDAVYATLAPEIEKWIASCGGERDIALATTFGSINQDLLTPTSDIDLVTIYMPTIADLRNKSFHGFKCITSVVDCDMYPAHKYIEYILKGNVNHVEPLYSSTCTATPEFTKIVENYLKPMSEMNVINNVRTAWFIIMRCYADSLMYNGKREWNAKVAANSLRLLAFLIPYLDEGKFEWAPRHGSVLRDAILQLKRNKMDHAEFQDVFADAYATALDKGFETYNGTCQYSLSPRVYEMDKTSTVLWSELHSGLYNDLMKLMKPV